MHLVELRLFKKKPLPFHRLQLTQVTFLACCCCTEANVGFTELILYLRFIDGFTKGVSSVKQNEGERGKNTSQRPQIVSPAL